MSICPTCGQEKPASKTAPGWRLLAIAEAVAKEHGTTVELILGSSRAQRVVKARWAVMVTASERLGLDHQTIGRLMGRDRSSVANALRWAAEERAKLS